MGQSTAASEYGEIFFGLKKTRHIAGSASPPAPKVHNGQHAEPMLVDAVALRVLEPLVDRGADFLKEHLSQLQPKTYFIKFFDAG